MSSRPRIGFILMAAALLLGLPGLAAGGAPDLTRGGKPDNKHRWTLGATGARGWFWSRNVGADQNSAPVLSIDELIGKKGPS